MYVLRRTRSRLAQLKAHLARVKWRDAQAAEAYYTLLLAQKPRSCVNLVMFDALMKEYYTDELIGTMAVENAFLTAFRKKAATLDGPMIVCVADERVPPDRAYVVPIEGLAGWLPAPEKKP